MVVDNKRQIREEADELYLRGLGMSAGRAGAIDSGDLKLAAELCQKAGALYRGIGDKGKAREVQVSLGRLYKKRLAVKREQEGLRSGLREKFQGWSMFFKIGCFGFGGPMAVFSLLEDELVQKKKILTNEDFLEGAVLGEILPGPVTMDIVTYTGYKLKKWSGALISTFVFILPSFLIMLGLAMLYEKYSITPSVEAVLGCLGAAVTGLILSVGLNLSKAEIKGYREAGILIGAFAATLVFELDIVLTVGFAGLVGIFLYRDDPETIKVHLDDYAA